MRLAWVERGIGEWRGRWIRPLPPRGVVPWVIGLSVAAVLGAAVGMIVLSPGPADPPPAIRHRAERHATERHVNPDAGYAFRHPPGWTVRDRGTASWATSPDRDVTAAFGFGAAGTLDRSSAILVSSILERYPEARAIGAEVTRVAGASAVSVSGTARNAEGVATRFLAVTIAGPERNYSVTVFTASGADAARVGPPVQEMLDSFRPKGRSVPG